MYHAKLFYISITEEGSMERERNKMETERKKAARLGRRRLNIS